jgi:hypothetical protein
VEESSWAKSIEGKSDVSCSNAVDLIGWFLTLCRQAEDMASRAQELNMLRNFIPRRGNGNHHSDHLLNLVEEGIAFATVNSSSGWGGDT